MCMCIFDPPHVYVYIDPVLRVGLGRPSPMYISILSVTACNDAVLPFILMDTSVHSIAHVISICYDIAFAHAPQLFAIFFSFSSS